MLLVCATCGECAPPSPPGTVPLCNRCQPVYCKCGAVCQGSFAFNGECEECYAGRQKSTDSFSRTVESLAREFE
jgi:hypothetical protein